MIVTSYFGNLKNLIVQFGKENIVSISRYSSFWKGKKCSMLAPSEDLLKRYKRGEITEDEYTEEFTKYLDTLNVDNCYKVFNGCVFVCYEKAGFCHRHLVAEWLRKNGYECYEYGTEEEENSPVTENEDSVKENSPVTENEVSMEENSPVTENEVSMEENFPVTENEVSLEEILMEFRKKGYFVDAEAVMKWFIRNGYKVKVKEE